MTKQDREKLLGIMMMAIKHYKINDLHEEGSSSDDENQGKGRSPF